MKKFIALTASVVLCLFVWNEARDVSTVDRAEEAARPNLVVTMNSEQEVTEAGVAESTAREAIAALAETEREASANAYRIHGRVVHVVDGAEQPASDVIVKLEPSMRLGDLSHLPHAAVVTDERGEFRATLEWGQGDSQYYRARIDEDEEFRYAYESFRVGTDEPRDIEVALRRHAHGDLHGRVVDRRGQPVAGVEVRSTDDRKRSGTVVSNADGSFLFETFRSDGRLIASKPGLAVLESYRPQPLADGGWPEVELIVTERATLAVRVVDSAGNAPDDCWVEIEPAPSEGSANVGSGRIEIVDGVAVFDDAWKDVKLRVTLSVSNLPLRFLRERDGVLVPPGELDEGQPIVIRESEKSVTVRLLEPRRFSGRVLDGHTGEPAVNAFVRLRSVERRYFTPGFVDHSTRSNERGEFEFVISTLDGGGEALLSASDHREPFFHWDEDAEVRSATLVVELGEAREDVTLLLEETATVAGRVVNAEGEGLES